MPATTGSSPGLDHAHVDVEREPFAVAVGDTQWIHEMCQSGQKDGMIVIYSNEVLDSRLAVLRVICVLCVFLEPTLGKHIGKGGWCLISGATPLKLSC